MRISAIEKKALDFALENIKDTVFLFGSRTDASKKGGDIDILVFSNQSPYLISKNISSRFFLKCESKIDVVVFNPVSLSDSQKAFINLQHLVQIR